MFLKGSAPNYEGSLLGDFIGNMNKFNVILILSGLLVLPLTGYGQDSGIDPMLDVSPTNPQTEEAASVTAVYGVDADDYLPLKEVARQHLRPNVRRSSSRPAFDLPDAFFFIGAPVFLVIFLRVMVIFLNGFEEKRKEEQRIAASEQAPGEYIAGE